MHHMTSKSTQQIVHLAAPYDEFGTFMYLETLGMRIRCAKRTHLRLKHQPVGRPLLAHRTPLSECAVTATTSSDFCSLAILLWPPYWFWPPCLNEKSRILGFAVSCLIVSASPTTYLSASDIALICISRQHFRSLQLRSVGVPTPRRS